MGATPTIALYDPIVQEEWGVGCGDCMMCDSMGVKRKYTPFFSFGIKVWIKECFVCKQELATIKLKAGAIVVLVIRSCTL